LPAVEVFEAVLTLRNLSFLKHEHHMTVHGVGDYGDLNIQFYESFYDICSEGFPRLRSLALRATELRRSENAEVERPSYPLMQYFVSQCSKLHGVDMAFEYIYAERDAEGQVELWTMDSIHKYEQTHTKEEYFAKRHAIFSAPSQWDFVRIFEPDGL